MSVATYENHSVQPEASVDPRLLRSVCGHFVTGVTVVTSMVDNEPLGLTINSFTSVSLDPPLILFCLRQNSRVRDVLRQSKVFAVNILAEDQENVSRSFATWDAPRFSEVRSRPGFSGAPILDDALAYLDCRLVDEVDAGDHAIVLGEVLDLGVLRHDSHPLTFYRSAHGRLRGRS
jgi:3-hydroxy-9,10-secoandrosta-1,3,5(10)-triene-9,17-dione monooxygenase reductase component